MGDVLLPGSGRAVVVLIRHFPSGRHRVPSHEGRIAVVRRRCRPSRFRCHRASHHRSTLLRSAGIRGSEQFGLTGGFLTSPSLAVFRGRSPWAVQECSAESVSEISNWSPLCACRFRFFQGRGIEVREGWKNGKGFDNLLHLVRKAVLPNARASRSTVSLPLAVAFVTAS